MANYPTSLPSTTPADHTVVNDEIVAIATELGLDPSGSFATVKARLDARALEVVNPAAASIVVVPGVTSGGTAASGPFAGNRDWYFPMFVSGSGVTLDQILVEVVAASASGVARLGIYNADSSWQPTTLVEDFGTVSTSSTGVKTIAPAGSTLALGGGRYLGCANLDQQASLRAMKGAPSSLVLAAVGASPNVRELYVTRTHAALPSTGTAWTTTSGVNDNFYQPLFYRLTAVS